MRKRLGTIVILFLCIGVEVHSQHLIGLSHDNIMQKMQETSFVLDNSSKNTTFKYLKFIDKIEEKTLLVFLSENNLCTSTKLMCDYSSYKETLNEFKNYKKISSSEWNYSINNITYTVILKKEEWFYSVIVTTKNKKLWKLRNY